MTYVMDAESGPGTKEQIGVWRRTHFGRPEIQGLPAGLRLYAIGDIHGRADLLERLFAAIDYNLVQHPTQRAVHVFLGDYIDRGPASRQVIDLLMDRGRAHELILLRGNHET